MLTVVVFGASGDLAQRKTYPALFALLRHGLMPEPFQIIGYARTVMDQAGLHQHLLPSLRKHNPDEMMLQKFLARCSYVTGQYDRDEDFLQLATFMAGQEERIFYLALPPSVFLAVGERIHRHLLTGRTRVIVEKPFGRKESLKYRKG